jgi:hypothetical protein
MGERNDVIAVVRIFAFIAWGVATMVAIGEVAYRYGVMAFVVSLMVVGCVLYVIAARAAGGEG